MYKFLKIIALTLILSLILILGLTAQSKKVMTEKQYMDNIKLKLAMKDDLIVHQLLFELFEKHGLNPEAVLLYEQLLAKKFDNTEDLDERTVYLEKMYAFADSLKNLCLAKDSTGNQIAKDCPPYLKTVDSLKLAYRKKLYGEN